MNEIQKIADQLQRSFHGNAWHGPALLELLAGMPAEKAAAKPASSAHSIGEIILHVGAWEAAARKWLAGELSEMPALEGEEDWPAVRDNSDAAWKQTVEDLSSAHEALVRQVLRLREEQLAEPVGGRDFTNYFLLHGLPQHNAYHAGQIALLKKLA